MPYRWFPPDGSLPRQLHLWTHQSLPVTGFVTFIAVTAALMSLPLLANLGSPSLWILLIFALAAIAAVWWALRRNARDRQVTEDLSLGPDRVILIRRDPRGQVKSWSANPHWVRVTLYSTDGPVPDYLTLTGEGREVELGAFLTPDERTALAKDLRAALAALK